MAFNLRDHAACPCRSHRSTCRPTAPGQNEPGNLDRQRRAIEAGHLGFGSEAFELTAAYFVARHADWTRSSSTPSTTLRACCRSWGSPPPRRPIAGPTRTPPQIDQLIRRQPHRPPSDRGAPPCRPPPSVPPPGMPPRRPRAADQRQRSGLALPHHDPEHPSRRPDHRRDLPPPVRVRAPRPVRGRPARRPLMVVPRHGAGRAPRCRRVRAGLPAARPTPASPTV